MATTVTVRLEESEKELIGEYARMHGHSVSEVFRSAVLSKIADELDLATAAEAYREYLADPVTYSHEEVMRELGLA
jgi:hypothetical protein